MAFQRGSKMVLLSCLRSSPLQAWRLPQSAPSAIASFRQKSTTSSDPGEPMEEVNLEADPKQNRGVEKCINSVTLLGRVGVDPQLRGTEQHPVVAFSLATNLRYKPGGPDSGNDYVSKTDWHNIAVFRPYLRDTVHQNVTKGMRVLVQGRIMYGTVEDKMGNLRHTTTIVADDVVRFN